MKNTKKHPLQNQLQTALTALSTRVGLDNIAEKSSPINPWSGFNTFDSHALTHMLSETQEFAFDLCTPLTQPHWLSLLGSCGAGKTMLSKIVQTEGEKFCKRFPRIENCSAGRRVQFGTWNLMAKRLRDGDYYILDDFLSAWLVVLDDIGAEYNSPSAFLTSKLYDLLCQRIGKWTVITSNLSLEQIADRLDARIASRMCRGESRVVEVDVTDYSLRKLASE